jgi:transcriptional regulator with XRE-family HTH domain
MTRHPAQRSSTAPDWRPAYLAVLADLRRARADSGLTQAEVAARLGIHMRTLRRWENGEGDPPAHMLFRWATAVGVVLKVDHGANLPHREPGEPIVLRRTMAPSLRRLVGGP